MKDEIFKCKTCGAMLGELAAKSTNGLVECPYCFNIWTIPKKETSPAALSFLRMGEHDLDTCKFDDALSAYKKAAELNSSEPEAYFGMALAEFKVQYLKDHVNNRLQPICHETTENKFTDSASFLKALRFATNEQRGEYEKKGAEIDYILAEFYQLKKTGVDYDCFLCVKVTDDSSKQPTEDSKDADYIYRLLQDKGFKPFYSERELRNVTGADYEARILYALYVSECMLVVCRNEAYLQTPWVKNEYTRFLKLVNDEEKESDSITIVFNGTPVERLPGRNGKLQGINFASTRDADRKILDFVEKHTPEAKAKRESDLRKKAEEEQARAHIFEEQQKLIEEQKKELERLREQSNAAQTGNLSGATLLEMFRKAQEEERIAKRAEIEKREILTIEKNKCIGCGLCVRNCSEKSIQKTDYIAPGHKLPSYEIDQESCTRCGECSKVCKFRAIETASERAKRERAEQEARKEIEEEQRLRAEARKREEAERIVRQKEEAEQRLREEAERIAREKEEEEQRRREEAERIAREKEEAEQKQKEEVARRRAEEERRYLEQFVIENGLLRVFKYNGTKKSITIPDNVTSIGWSAFGDCKEITEVIIPNTVTSIGQGAFANCSILTNVTIPDGTTSIGKNVFLGCERLKNIEIPDSVTSIGEYAFCKCSSLASIEIPDSVTSIGVCAFLSCSGLTSVAIGNSVTEIGDNAFTDCKELKSITVINNPKYHSAGNCLIETESKTLIVACHSSKIPSDGSVTSIGVCAFDGCSGLTSITIPNSVTSIGDGAFIHCSGLTSVTIGSGVTSIGDWAFCDCKGLTSITIPDSVTSIGEDAFRGCSGLTSITIPDSVTSIGKGAFCSCKGLKSVRMPRKLAGGIFKKNLEQIFCDKYGDFYKDIKFKFT